MRRCPSPSQPANQPFSRIGQWNITSPGGIDLRWTSARGEAALIGNPTCPTFLPSLGGISKLVAHEERARGEIRKHFAENAWPGSGDTSRCGSTHTDIKTEYRRRLSGTSGDTLDHLRGNPELLRSAVTASLSRRETRTQGVVHEVGGLARYFFEYGRRGSEVFLAGHPEGTPGQNDVPGPPAWRCTQVTGVS